MIYTCQKDVTVRQIAIFQPIIFRKSGLIGRTYAQGQASVITPDLSETGETIAVKVRCIHRLCDVNSPSLKERRRFVSLLQNHSVKLN